MNRIDRQSNSILVPSELNMLRRVLDRLCSSQHVRADTDEGSEMALRAIYFYECGVVDEEELFVAASGKRGLIAPAGGRRSAAAMPAKITSLKNGSGHGSAGLNI